MDVRSFFKEEFNRVRQPLSDKARNAAEVVRRFIAEVNRHDGVEMELIPYGGGSDTVNLKVAIEGGEYIVMMRLRYDDPASDQILARPIVSGADWLGDDGKVFYDLEKQDDRQMLLAEIIKEAAHQAADAQRVADFRKFMTQGPKIL